MKEIKATSIFEAIQGEGLNTGIYTLFIRLYTKHCFPNKKRCKFCDTVNQDYYKPNFNEEQILKKVKEINPSMITITGGEFFRLDTKVAENFIFELSKVCDYIELETNGSFDFKQATLMKYFKNINISLKLENAQTNFKYDYAVLKNMNELYSVSDKFSWKFVVGKNTDKDIKIIKDAIKKISIKKKNVWLMGMTPNKVEFRKEIADLCIENKYNYSPRLHIDLYGDVDFEV